MKKIKALIIFLSFFILFLAIYILINIYTISSEPSITTNGITANTSNDNKEDSDKIGFNPDLDKLLTDTVNPTIPTLTDDEKGKIVALRSPFGTSPIVNKDFKEVEKVYQEKIKAEKIKAAKENAIKKLTESMGEKPTEQQIKDFIADGTIPQTEFNQPKEDSNSGEDSSLDVETEKNKQDQNTQETIKNNVKEEKQVIESGK